MEINSLVLLPRPQHWQRGKMVVPSLALARCQVLVLNVLSVLREEKVKKGKPCLGVGGINLWAGESHDVNCEFFLFLYVCI